MLSINQKIIALALATALGSPLALAQSSSAFTNKPVTANAPASDAISTRTTARESTGHVATGANMAANTSTNTQATEAKDPPGKGNWWNDADTNGDGKISLEESAANAGLQSRFSVADTNHDGFVTNEEYRQLYTSNASQGEVHAAAHSAVVTRALWGQLDANSDAKISVAEAAANADVSASFSAMDGNGDGFVTRAEYTAYARAHK